MNRKKLSKLFLIAAVLLVVLFFAATAISWHSYTTTLNSAPFWVFIVVHALELLLPAAVLAGIGVYLRRK